MNTWDKLSMAERAEIMKIAVEGGVTSLDAIRRGYNEFALGGDTGDSALFNDGDGAYSGQPTLDANGTYSVTYKGRHYSGIDPNKGDITEVSILPEVKVSGQKKAYGGFSLSGPLVERALESERRNLFAGGGNSDEISHWEYMPDNGWYGFSPSAFDAEGNFRGWDNVHVNIPEVQVTAKRPAPDLGINVQQAVADRLNGDGLRPTPQKNFIQDTVDDYIGELKYDINNNVPIGGKYTMPAIGLAAALPWLGEVAAGTNIAGVPAMTWADAGLTAGFAGHGLHHLATEGVNGYGDAAMTALELAPLGRVAKPIYKYGKESIYSTIEPLSSLIANSNVGKRTLEVSMQTSPDHIPFSAMKEGIKSMLRHGEFGRIKDIGRYVFTGKPGRVGYNHLNKDPHLIYTGLGGEQNGYIRSLLYGEHPHGGLKYIGTAEDVPVGEHLSTIQERGYTPSQIKVYETDVPYDYEFNPATGIWDSEQQSFVSPIRHYQPLQGGNLIVPEKEIEPLIKSVSAEGSFSIGSTGKLYDGQGHRLQYATYPEEEGTGGLVRGQDLTDFNFESYGDKWLPGKSGYLYTLGLKTADKATTPIIVRTPWGYTNDLETFLNWHRAFDWNETGKYVPNDLFYKYRYGGRLTL